MKASKKIAIGNFQNGGSVTASVPLCPDLWDLVEEDAARFGISVSDFISAMVRKKYNGSYVVDGVLMGYKSLISNEEQIFKRCARF